jgi:hypothetical protein
MRHMGWSYADLMVCPVDYVAVIVELAEQDERAREADRRARETRL